MSEDVISDKIISLTSSEAKNEIVINDLIDKMVKVEMEVFEELIDNFIKKNGIEKTLLQIIFPFLERIGVLWLTNHINPAQEHLVTNIIRQKIIVGIESVRVPATKNKSVCLFLPEGEYHELSLLFITYLLRKEGINTIYLGASIPLNDMNFIVKLKKPDFIYSHLTSITRNFNFDKFIKAIHSLFPHVPVIISGKYTEFYEKKLPGNIYFKRSISEVRDFINSF
jgi:methanogenic corrinoid protein MtbC1